VTHEQRRFADRIQTRNHRVGVAVEVAERIPRITVARKVNRLGVEAFLPQRFKHTVPTPRAMPRAVDEQHVTDRCSSRRFGTFTPWHRRTDCPFWCGPASAPWGLEML
jgi:hypothetical protein